MLTCFRKSNAKLCRRKVAPVTAVLVFTLFLYAQYKIVQRQIPNYANIHSGQRVFCPSLQNRSHVAMEHAKRRTAMQDTCRRYSNSRWRDAWRRMRIAPQFDRSPLISSKNKLLLCVAAKVGSTFFSRWMKSMEYPGPMPSPLDIPLSEAKRNYIESLESLQSEQSKLDFITSATKVVFGRDPFSRVFSAYVDKLYSPNPIYWREWGQKALRAAHYPVMHCGSNVTFSQFVNLFFSSQNRRRLDFHLIPLSKECRMCELDYNVIGKLETLADDLDYVSELVNISSRFQYEERYKRALQMDSIMDTANSVFSWKQKIQGCMSVSEMAKRVWRKFQMRGVIDSVIGFPLMPGQAEAMTVDGFVDLCKEAIAKSTDRAKLRRQKRVALEEAYGSVPLDLIRHMKEFYKLDIQLFGYSQTFDYLEDQEFRNKSVATGVFNWNSPWHLP